MNRSFDPHSPGARMLARQWLRWLERWELRVPDGHVYVEEDGSPVTPGESFSVGGPRGRELAASGYEVLSVTRVSARQ